MHIIEALIQSMIIIGAAAFISAGLAAFCLIIEAFFIKGKS